MKDLEKAIKITEACFKLAKKIISVDVSEKHIASSMRKHAISLGADGLAFRTIFASSNYDKIHSSPTDRKIKRNEFIIVDFGVRCGKAKTDVTRTYCINPDKNKIKLYNLLKNAQKIAERNIKTGSPCNRADVAARKYLKKHSRMKFPYAIGHGLGKKVHDKPKISPKSEDMFKKGDIFTLEPGLHSKKNGLRIEDMYLLRRKGIIKLTKNISSDLNV